MKTLRPSEDVLVVRTGAYQRLGGVVLLGVAAASAGVAHWAGGRRLGSDMVQLFWAGAAVTGLGAAALLTVTRSIEFRRDALTCACSTLCLGVRILTRRVAFNHVFAQDRGSGTLLDLMNAVRPKEPTLPAFAVAALRSMGPGRTQRVGEFPTADSAADVAEEIAQLTGAMVHSCRGDKVRVDPSELVLLDELAERLQELTVQAMQKEQETADE